MAKNEISKKKYSGVDYFWTFSEVRKALEKKGLRPACRGALREVFPGGLMGETSLGMVAFRFDNNGEIIDRVHLFDPVDPTEYESVVFFEEQNNYRKVMISRRGEF